MSEIQLFFPYCTNTGIPEYFIKSRSYAFDFRCIISSSHSFIFLTSSAPSLRIVLYFSSAGNEARTEASCSFFVYILFTIRCIAVSSVSILLISVWYSLYPFASVAYNGFGSISVSAETFCSPNFNVSEYFPGEALCPLKLLSMYTSGIPSIVG